MNSTEGSTSLFGDSVLSLAIIFDSLILILSAMGSVLVLSAVCFKPRFSRPANFMLANLCITALFQVATLLFTILLKSYPIFSFGPWTCPLYSVVRACTLPAEGFTVMCISLECSKASVRPLERMSGRKVAKKILVIWISSLIIELPGGFYWKYAEDAPSFLKCVNIKEFFGSRVNYMVYICSYFLVAVILPLCFMLKESLLLASRLKFLMTTETELSQYQLCKYKLIRNALIFIVIYICFKLPVNSVYFIRWMPPDVFPQSVSDWAAAWKNIIYHIGPFNVTIYIFIIFALSNNICDPFACFLRAQRRSPARVLDRIPVRLLPLGV